MTLIYKIVDNDTNECYIGSTKQKIYNRLSTHKKQNSCSSWSIIKKNNYKVLILEECNELNRNEREQYYININDCVNIKNVIWDEKTYKKEYSKNHKKEKAEYDKIRRDWIKTFGETKRDTNNLLYIKMDLFC
tara:strand:+ start:1034 stop:1432 length:399 start_codon:yes stop_codon:yes gene_type:complete